MALKHRIGRLEVHARGRVGPYRCPECGHAPGDEITVEIGPPGVVRSMDDLAPVDAEAASDRCVVCRRRLVYRMPSPRLTRVGA